MISIIVCHRNKDQLATFKTSIEESIGGLYELIIINNSTNLHSIFEAYNLGIKKAQGDILAFCHEDITFHSKNWDQKLHNHFNQDSKLGLIGVVGGTALPAVPAPWWNHHPLNIQYINVIQQWKDVNNTNKWNRNISLGNNRFQHINNPSDKNINEVVAVDGFFMACPKSIFKDFLFDNNTFKSFHCYDIDTCLQVISLGYKVAVIHDILVEHCSEGSINKQWAESAIICARKWKQDLPLAIHNNLNSNTKLRYNIDSLLSFCYWTMDKISPGEKKKIISEFLPDTNTLPISKNHLFLILWKYLGYNKARYPYKLLKHFFND